MQKIMFICTGNICRSAMAEKMLKKEIEEQKLDMEVYSCGVAAVSGDKPTSEAIFVMKEEGIDLKSHEATNIVDSKIEEMDLILCATTNHTNTVNQMYPDLSKKIFTMKQYAGEIAEGPNIDDPWGEGLVSYNKCVQELEKCINKIVEKHKENEKDRGIE